MSNSPEHLDDMKKFIGSVYSPDLFEEQVVQSEYPPVLEQAHTVACNLESIGLERLSILFAERSHAEIVLENCITFKNKLASGDFHTAMQIAEAFASIFSKIEKDRFEIAGLNENEIIIISENAQVLNESFLPEEEPKEDKAQKLVESIQTLIERWEMHKETIEKEDDKILAEGIELGYAKAASELMSLLEDLKPKEVINEVAVTQEITECL